MDWATVEEGGEVAHLKDKAQRWGGQVQMYKDTMYQ